MTFSTLEAEIIQQLQPIQDLGVSVISLPERVNEIGSPNTIGWVQLEWISTTLDDYSVREENAELTVTYNLDVYCENLREDPASLYNVINLISDSLWGFRPSSAYRPCTYVQSETQRFDANYWIARFTLIAYVLRGAVLLQSDTSEDPIATDIQFIPAD